MSSGRPAIAVVANAGTTNTGSVDPLRDTAAVARAYGAAAILDPSTAAYLQHERFRVGRTAVMCATFGPRI